MHCYKHLHRGEEIVKSGRAKSAKSVAAYPMTVTIFQGIAVARKTVLGLLPNSLYQFSVRYVGARSNSLLSAPLELMTAPRAPLEPVVISTSASSARAKLYASAGGLHRFVMQLRQRSGQVSASASSLPSKSGRASRGAGETSAAADIRALAALGLDESDGWKTVFCSHETLWTSTTLSSDTEYGLRAFALNAQGICSEPSSEVVFRTRKRVLSKEEKKEQPLSTEDRLRLSRTGKSIRQQQQEEREAAESRRSSDKAQALTKRDTVLMKAESTFTVECRQDMCVGDTILFTERLYLRPPRASSPFGDQGDVTGAPALTAGASTASSRMVNGRRVARVDRSGERQGNDDVDDALSRAATVHESAGALFLGERTVAAHIVRDNFRTLQSTGAFDDVLEANERGGGESMVTALQNTVTNMIRGADTRGGVRGSRQGSVNQPRRRLWLEVVWQRSSSPACAPYELMPGEVIERTQDSLQEFEVFRCPWDDDEHRHPYTVELTSLLSCYYDLPAKSEDVLVKR